MYSYNQKITADFLLQSSPKDLSPETVRITRKLLQTFPRGIFSTGIENSDPMVQGVRRNQLAEAHDFYANYESRLKNIKALGIDVVRVGMGYSQAHPTPDTYDFSFMDKIVECAEKLDIVLIADLLHFGLPDWLHEETPETPYFQNPHFPEVFAEYVAEFVRRYPTITYFTPVNEPSVTSVFSAFWGNWNEHKTGNRSFIQAVKNVAKAAILAKHAIETVWRTENRPGEPIFFQNDSFELAIDTPGSGRRDYVDHLNLIRFASLDLIFGRRCPKMRKFMVANGLTSPEYEWFMQHGNLKSTVLGIDFYPTNARSVLADREILHDPNMPYLLYEVTKQFSERYGNPPLLHMEVNNLRWFEFAEEICFKTYGALCRLRNDGYPILGMAWFGDEVQVGWQTQLCGPEAYEETPVGLFYKGQLQPVAKLFSNLAKHGLIIPLSQIDPFTSDPEIPTITA